MSNSKLAGSFMAKMSDNDLEAKVGLQKKSVSEVYGMPWNDWAIKD